MHLSTPRSGDLVDESILILTTGKQPTDDELVAAAKLALPAFEQLYLRYVNDVFQFCRRRLDSEADAADATSAIFTRALANIKACQPATFRSWLYAIGRNVITDHYRAVRPTEALDASWELADQTVGPEDLAIQHDEHQSLEGVLDRLSEEQRSVIELRLAGLTGNEIAQVLGKSRNAIDQAQFRAISRLRVLLVPPAVLMEESP
jgi:RNA polymerase sigma factor (sigma-70 family)